MSIAHFTDAELKLDVQNFAETYLPSIEYEKVLRAAKVAKDIRLYDEVARSPDPSMALEVPVLLSPEEKYFLRRERDVVFSERGMRKVIFTVSLAALLQGFVQSSFNGASFYRRHWGLDGDNHEVIWRLGGTNASPWFAAALLGCPLSLPINYWFGRRGGLLAASVLIFASSVGSIFATTWVELCCIRVVNGLGEYLATASREAEGLIRDIKAWESKLSALPFWLLRLPSAFGEEQLFLLGNSGRHYGLRLKSRTWLLI